MKTFKLRNGEYSKKEEALVEINEELPPEVKTVVVSEQKILNTIQFLENKKLEINTEIDYNKGLLKEIKKANKDAIISEKSAEI